MRRWKAIALIIMAGFIVSLLISPSFSGIIRQKMKWIFEGDVDIHDDLTVTDGASIGGNLDVAGVATLNAVTLSGTLTGASGSSVNLQDSNATLVIPVTTTAPSTPATGQIFLSGNSVYYYTGSAWKALTGS